jgi:hypothetical protein
VGALPHVARAGELTEVKREHRLRCRLLFSLQMIGATRFTPSTVIPSRRRGTCCPPSRRVIVCLPFRHPGARRDPASSALLSSECFARCRERVTFLCLCKEKVTKRKHTPSVAPGALRRVHGLRGVFSTAHPCAGRKTRGLLPRALAGLIRDARRDQGPRQVNTSVGSRMSSRHQENA